MVISFQWICGGNLKFEMMHVSPQTMLFCMQCPSRHQCMQSCQARYRDHIRGFSVFPVWPGLSEDWKDCKRKEEASLYLQWYSSLTAVPISPTDTQPPAAATLEMQWNLLQNSTRCWDSSHCRGEGPLSLPESTATVLHNCKHIRICCFTCYIDGK